jgi:hypothetical protein
MYVHNLQSKTRQITSHGYMSEREVVSLSCPSNLVFECNQSTFYLQWLIGSCTFLLVSPSVGRSQVWESFEDDEARSKKLGKATFTYTS